LPRGRRPSPRSPALDFEYVRTEHPERIAFHTLNLSPHWFVNVDSRQFTFTDVSWDWDRIDLKQDSAVLEAIGFYRLRAIACRQLAENAEANNCYEEASRFRYWAMDLARQSKWKGWAFWKTDWLHMLYWAVSGYGERILRALGVLAGVWLVFAFLYTRVGFMPLPPKPPNDGESSMMAAIVSVQQGTGQPIEFSRALTYSLGVMSLHKPEPKRSPTLRKRSSCLRLFSDPYKQPCSRSPSVANSCVERKARRRLLKESGPFLMPRFYRQETPSESAV